MIETSRKNRWGTKLSRGRTAGVVLALTLPVAACGGGEDPPTPEELRPQIVTMCEAVAAVPSPAAGDVAEQFDALASKLDAIEATFENIPEVQGTVKANIDRGLKGLDDSRERALLISAGVRASSGPVDVHMATLLVQASLDTVVTALGLRSDGRTFRTILREEPSCADVVTLAKAARSDPITFRDFLAR